MSPNDPNRLDDNRPGFLRRHTAATVASVVAVFVIATVVVVFLRDKDQQPVRRLQEITMVTIQPPPPPPPPQPLPQPKMIEQPKMVEPEQKPVTPPPPQPRAAPPRPAPAAPPTGPLGLDSKVTGPADGFNLAGNPGGNGLLGGGGGGSRWGWYASIVQTQIADALRANRKTRGAVVTRVEVRLWSDASGRIERAQLVSSSGDPAVDAAITNEVLTGLQLREPPPRDMPMPIVTRLTEQRPG